MYNPIRRWLFRFQISFGYFLVKLKFLQRLLPQRVRTQLPLGWNERMFWTAFKSGGDKVYADYFCQLQAPDSYEPKVLVDQEYRFSEEQIKFFYENGYLGPFDLIPSDEMEQVREHLLNHIHQESSVYSYSQGDYEIKQNNQAGRNEDYVFKLMNSKDRHLDNPLLLSLFKKPAITERLAQLLGSDLMLWRTQFFRKYPGGPPTPWHQATTYLSDDLRSSVVYPPDQESLFQLTCWIALTDATKENGCMTILPGTHTKLCPIRTNNYYQKKPGKEQTELSRIEVDYPIDDQDVKAIEMKA
jgi:non-haem Fe2+, alpha-ketoglutarate-dependent halogenase